jgi:hypothetical protein
LPAPEGELPLGEWHLLRSSAEQEGKEALTRRPVERHEPLEQLLDVREEAGFPLVHPNQAALARRDEGDATRPRGARHLVSDLDRDVENDERGQNARNGVGDLDARHRSVGIVVFAPSEPRLLESADRHRGIE